MDARVGHCAFPVCQKEILLGEAPERPAFDRVILGVLDARFDLPFVFRSNGLGWQNRGSVVSCEGLDLGIELRIEPICLDDGGSVKDFHCVYHAWRYDLKTGKISGAIR